MATGFARRQVVLVVDPDPDAREHVRDALGPATQLLEARQVPEMLPLAPLATLVVLDAGLTKRDVADALALLRERYPDLPVIVTSTRDDVDEMRRLLDLGAASYTRKSASPECLRTLVEAALSGHPVLGADVVRPSLDHYEGLLANARSRDRAIIESLAAAVEAKDSVTSRHLHEVGELAIQLARLVEPALTESEGFLFGCLLHDVGKIGVPERILTKPGPLDGAEWEIMKRHPQTGDRVIRPLGLDPVVSQIVLHHHERWDGQGYPAGLASEGIPLAARIFSVCDALEAMTAPRPYRAPLAVGEAFRRVRAASGGQFDPAVVGALERGVSEGTIELEARPESLAVSSAR
jgi:putative two-component system response regulator